MAALLSQASAAAEELTALRRQLHQCPEIAFELPKTKEIITRRLAALSIHPIECGGGLLADIGHGTRGRTILVRADMDALPMEEKSGLPFAATGSACHACGHDFHMAMLWGAAKLLQGSADALPGRVRLMFEPAEELAKGAQSMLAQGALDGVDAALGLHVAPGAEAGYLNCTPGAKTASFDLFSVTFTGKGGHGAQPQHTADPISAAVHAYTALQAMISRECAPDEPAVVTIGSFHAGTAGNIIPETARFEGTCRAASREGRELLKRRMTEICEGIALALRVRAEVQWQAEIPVVYNHPGLTGAVAQSLAVNGLNADMAVQRLNASDDFSLIAQSVPAVFMTIGTGPSAGGNHNPAVRYDERVLPVGAAALAIAAVAAMDAQGLEV